jgi:hypothetical protein
MLVDAVTVMMRLVFLLAAEERGLFLLGEQLYDESYAIFTLLVSSGRRSGSSARSRWRSAPAPICESSCGDPEDLLPGFGVRQLHDRGRVSAREIG